MARSRLIDSQDSRSPISSLHPANMILADVFGISDRLRLWKCIRIRSVLDNGGFCTGRISRAEIIRARDLLIDMDRSNQSHGYIRRQDVERLIKTLLCTYCSKGYCLDGHLYDLKLSFDNKLRVAGIRVITAPVSDPGQDARPITSHASANNNEAAHPIINNHQPSSVVNLPRSTIMPASVPSTQTGTATKRPHPPPTIHHSQLAWTSRCPSAAAEGTRCHTRELSSHLDI